MNYKTRQPFPHAAYVEGQRNFTYFDRSLTSGLTDVVIESPGDFLYIDQASTGVVSVELNMRQGGTLAPILLAAGGSIECDFSSIKLNATTQLNKSVRIIVGNGARIKGGANVNAESDNVSVVDGGLVRSKAGKAFIGAASSAAVAGQYSQTQLYNPAASGKYLYVSQISAYVGANMGITIGYGTAAFSAAVSSPSSKKIGGTAPVGQTRNEANASPLRDASFMTIPATSTALALYSFREPLIVPPGYGVNCCPSSVNQLLITNFEWFEE